MIGENNFELMRMVTNGATPETGRVTKSRLKGRGPAIWLAGDPDDLKEWMPLGAAGIVTNTVVLNQLRPKYGLVKELIKRYLDILTS